VTQAAGDIARAEPAALLQDHPLAGTLWRGGEQVEPESFFAAAASHRYILLGEKHDNARHHALQAFLLDGLTERGRRPAVVWEMADARYDEAFARASGDDLPALGKALEWEERGWPSWPDYAPIAGVALAAGLPMTGGAPPPDLLKALMQGTPLPEREAERIGWSRVYQAAQREALLAQLEDSHCGYLPESALPGMAEVQRLRDAWMAAALREADQGEGSVLITGAQHAREDRGVPWHLGGEVLTIAFEEVVRGKERPEDYPALSSGLFDFVWLTARVDEEDPCARFGGRKQKEG
jgi:uncharacterized iron-regulated protein